jgi:hypothetical protein
MFNIDQMRDNRTTSKLRSDFHKNTEIREEQVMTALVAEYVARGYPRPSFEKVDKNEYIGSFKGESKPDQYFYVNGKTITYEIKFNNEDHFHEHDGIETVFVKVGSIYAMLNEPRRYPNGHAIISTTRNFAILTASAVSKYPRELAKQYSNDTYKKYVFCIPASDLDWKPWMTPIPDIETRSRW